MKGLVVLGSTGSVGLQTLDIARAFPDEFRVIGLAARRSFLPLRTQIKEFQPKYVSFEGTDDERAEFASNGRVICSMEEMVAFPDVDLVVSATVGDAALGPTIAAIEAGKEIVLVNKEAIIMAGPLSWIWRASTVSSCVPQTASRTPSGSAFAERTRASRS